MEDDLQKQIDENNKCLGLVISKDEGNKKVTGKIVSWECNRKNSVICSVDNSHFTAPFQRTKFPCIQQNKENRVKRKSDREPDKGKK